MRYPLNLTRSWLGWLAQQMQDHNQAVFYLEHLQPDWLDAKQRRTYEWLGVRLPAIMIGALVSILIGWLFFIAGTAIYEWLPVVTIGGLLGSFLCPKAPDNTARTTPKMRARWGTALFISIGIGLVIGWSKRGIMLNDWLSSGYMYGLIFSLNGFLLQMLLPTSLHRSSLTCRPGLRGWLSSLVQQFYLRPALLVTLFIGLSFGLNVGLSFGLSYGPSFGLFNGLSFGLSFGVSFGLASMLIGVILEHLQGGIHLTERLSWTRRNLRNRLFASAHLRLMLILTGCIIVFYWLSGELTYGLALAYRLPCGLTCGLSVGLRYGLSFGLPCWLLLGLYQSIAQERIEDRNRRQSNQGTRRSLHNSLLLGLITGL